MTVSTVGLVSKIRQLTRDLPEISLAVSLHAPNQALRETIVPTAKNFPITDIVDALDNHMQTIVRKRNGRETTRRRAMIEYVLLEGPTSTFEAAHELGKLCQNRSLVVNLIPYNATDVADKLQCPSNAHMMEFRNIVASYKVFCTIRRTMGADIDSACGQLIQKQQHKPPTDVVPDIEDVTASQRPNDRRRRSIAPIADTSDDCLDLQIRVLSIATALSAAAFAVTSFLYCKRKR